MTRIQHFPYITTIRGIPYAIAEEDGRMVWVAAPPACECGASLGRFSDPQDRRLSVAGDWFGVPKVHCDTCGREARIEEVKPCAST